MLNETDQCLTDIASNVSSIATQLENIDETLTALVAAIAAAIAVHSDTPFLIEERDVRAAEGVIRTVYERRNSR
jgi:hypothetical protein